MRRDLSKKDLYESVKTLIERESTPHIHLDQQKLFTLFSIGFQYFLFKSTKNPGAYIIRVEDSLLADKLGKKAKDPSTRKFMQSLMIPRKLKFKQSTFYLDFFHVGTWNLTNEIPASKLQGALIVKNTSSRPMDDLTALEENEEDQLKGLPEDYYHTMLKEAVPESIVIAFEKNYKEVPTMQFPFIKNELSKEFKGVRLGKDVDIEDLY